MTPNSYFMCHFGSSGYSGNYLDVQKGAAFEKRQTEKMLDIYSEVCSEGKYFKDQYTDITEDKVKNYLKRKLKDGDWYLDPPRNRRIEHDWSGYASSGERLARSR